MKQLSDNWSNVYYLTKEGIIYNSKTNKYIKADKDHCFRLKTAEGSYKKISLRSLYKQVYDEWFVVDCIEPISEDEVWKVIPNTENKYFVSNYGRIKSLCGIEAIILKPSLNKGYEKVTIIENGAAVNRLVSRLVAASFLPMPQSIDMQLHHKNLNKLDNRSCNLEWLTVAQHHKLHRELREAEKDKKKDI